MLISTYSRGQYDWHVGIADCREAHIYGTSPGRPLDVIHRAEGYRKGKDPVLLVEQMPLEVSRLLAAENEGGPNGPVCRIKYVLGEGTERNDPRIPAQFDIFSQELLSKAVAVGFSREKSENVPFLQLSRNACCNV